MIDQGVDAAKIVMSTVMVKNKTRRRSKYNRVLLSLLRQRESSFLQLRREIDDAVLEIEMLKYNALLSLLRQLESSHLRVRREIDETVREIEMLDIPLID